MVIRTLETLTHGSVCWAGHTGSNSRREAQALKVAVDVVRAVTLALTALAASRVRRHI